MPDSISFPDAPRSQLDVALTELVDHARDVMVTQGRLRALLRANQAVVELMELPEVLRRIVEVAVELVDARYGALGVIAPNGELEQFIHVGMPDAEVAAIGHLPVGHGLLGALTDDPHPIRLRHIADDSRSAGFPAHHPPMDSFLGVPIRIRGTVFGNLYLSDHASGDFSADDVQLVTSLAATAGFAIENARLYAETRSRQAWSAASAEVTASMLSADEEDPMVILVERLLTLADADLVVMTTLAAGGDEIQVRAASGLAAAELVGRRFPLNETIAGRAFDGGQPLLVNDGPNHQMTIAAQHGLGAVMALPLSANGTVQSVVVVTKKHGRASFENSDLEMAADFAGQASVALEVIKSRTARQQMLVLEDRGRIARDLHDHVIQQLFGTGLLLQSIAGALPPPASVQILESVNNIDRAIAQIRTAIFALSTPSSGGSITVRHRFIDLVTEMTTSLGRTPTLEFGGPVDLVITDSLADDVLAVAREALTNIARHAEAQSASIRLVADGAGLELSIDDDGHGLRDSTRRSGLANLEVRATSRGGTSTVESSSAGTQLRWRVPTAQPTGRT
ncbi:sensor histidine kinase [Lacisediminihabitans changchengi]|nr:GAF domain-containing protein [Lacisediminihabitans changchengi]